jgi:carboxylesterase
MWTRLEGGAALSSSIVMIVAVAFAALLAGLGVAGSSAFGISVPHRGTPDPARDPEEAMRRLAALQARSAERTPPACVTALYEPDPAVASAGTCILLHGFTNCPAQFADVAEKMRSRGCRVLVPRMPRHGRDDVMTGDLAELSSAELVAFADEIVDTAAGFGEPVRVVGLSAGAIVAAWAGAFRSEVDRVALIAPIAAPKGFPLFVVRLLIRFHAVLPKLWVWWDPRLRANLGESPYVYPGFHLPGLVPFLHLATALREGRVEPTNRLRRVVLLTNPGDFAVRHDVARAFVFGTFSGHADVVAEAVLDETLGWWHDFVDPHSKHGATADEVARVVCALLGLGDCSAGTLLSTPAPPADEAP